MPEDLSHYRDMVARGGVLIDVRTPAEFETAHAVGARSVPLDRLDPAAVVRDLPTGAAVHLICQSGARAAMARELFQAAGIECAAVVPGGTAAWIACGLPVVRGARTISLERQVRIVAGALVVTGVALGALVHPWLYVISGFVGAGLVFAGVTDTCGMGMLLARMPWNRAGGSKAKHAGDRAAPAKKSCCGP
jgi:rhodanese-related sulfurtransferase